MVLQAKKYQTVPARAGDRASNRGQRFVWSSLVFEIFIANGHAVLDAPPFANEPCACDRPILPCAPPAPIGISAIEILRNGLEPRDRLWLEPTVGEFLDAVSEPAFEEAAVIRRGLRSEELTPLLLQFGRFCDFQRRYPGQHRIAHVSPSRSLGRA